MESYYSSDEEIAWGPLTLREIKKELKRKPNRVDRRQTDFGYYTYSLPKMDSAVEKPIDVESNKSTASGSSVYFTPNETIYSEPAVNENEIFLEKLAKVIEGKTNDELEPSSHASSSPLSTTQVKPANADTIMRIINSNNSYTKHLEDIQQSLVDNTIYLSPEKHETQETVYLSPKEDKESAIHKNSIVEEVLDESGCSDSEDDIIVITDDSSDESIEHIYEPVDNIVKHEKCSKIPQEINTKENKEKVQLEEDSDSSEDIADLLLELKQIREKQKILSKNDESSVFENEEFGNNEHDKPNNLITENSFQLNDHSIQENSGITENEVLEISQNNYSTSEEVANSKTDGKQETLSVYDKSNVSINEEWENNEHEKPSSLESENNFQLDHPMQENNVITENKALEISQNNCSISKEEVSSSKSQDTESSEDIADLLLKLKEIREHQKSLSMDTDRASSINEEWNNNQHERLTSSETENSRNLQLDDHPLQEDNVSTENEGHEALSSNCSILEEVSNPERQVFYSHPNTEEYENILTNHSSSLRIENYQSQSNIEQTEIKLITEVAEKDNINTQDDGENIYSKSIPEQHDVINQLTSMRLEEDKLNISGVNCLSTSSQSATTYSEECNGYEVNSLPKSAFQFSSSSTSLINPAPSLESSKSEVSTDCTDKSYVFNDTIEEMEMVLRQGFDYVIPKSNIPKDGIQKSNTNSEPVTVTKPSIKPPASKIPLNKFDYLKSPVGNYIRKEKSPPNDNFKLPLKPPKGHLKTPTARSPLTHSKKFKNVVSPIGIYIKNSPSVCLKQNVPVKTVQNLGKCTTSTEIPRSNKENITTELPEVIYKPPKKTVTSAKKEVVLPPSIQKLVQEVAIMKHEKRVNTKPLDKTAISRKLLEDDLTAVDDSLLSQSSGDISYVTKKQAFIK